MRYNNPRRKSPKKNKIPAKNCISGIMDINAKRKVNFEISAESLNLENNPIEKQKKPKQNKNSE